MSISVLHISTPHPLYLGTGQLVVDMRFVSDLGTEEVVVSNASEAVAPDDAFVSPKIEIQVIRRMFLHTKHQM